MAKQFPLTSGARTAMIVVGVLCCLLVFALPIGIWVFYRLGKAKVTLTPEGLEAVNVFSGTRYAWTDVERLGLMQVAVAKGGGVAGAMAREKTGGDAATHLIVRTKAGDNRSFMVSSYENMLDILDEVEQRVGKPYETVEPGAAGAMGAKWPTVG
jgi:hypothetical protein